MTTIVPFIWGNAPAFSGEGLSEAQEAALTAATRRAPVATIAALQALTPTDGDVVYVAGYAAAGDGGGGIFLFLAASAAAANGGTVIAPGAGGGRWLRRIDGNINVAWFGAAKNGADCTAAFQSAHDAAHAIGAKVQVGPFAAATDYYRINSRVDCRVPMVGAGNSRVNQPYIRTYVTGGLPTFKWASVDLNDSQGGLLWADLRVICDAAAETVVFEAGTSFEDVNSRWSLRNIRVAGNAASTGLSAVGWVNALYDFSATGCLIGVSLESGNSVLLHNTCLEQNATGIKLTNESSTYISGTIEGNTVRGIEVTGSSHNLTVENCWMEQNGVGLEITGTTVVKGISFRGCAIDSMILPYCQDVVVDRTNILSGEIYVDFSTSQRVFIDVERWANATATNPHLSTASLARRATEPPINTFPNPYFRGGLRGFTGAITLTNCTAAEEVDHETVNRPSRSCLKAVTTANGAARIEITAGSVEDMKSWLGKKVFCGAWVHQEENAGSAPIRVEVTSTIGGTTRYTLSPAAMYKHDKWLFTWSWMDLTAITSGALTSSAVTIVLPTTEGAVSRITGMFIGTGFDAGLVTRGFWTPSPDAGLWVGDHIWLPGTAAPTDVDGAWKVGDRVVARAPAAGGTEGWICTAAGSPGTWKTYGVIQA